MHLSLGFEQLQFQNMKILLLDKVLFCLDEKDPVISLERFKRNIGYIYSFFLSYVNPMEPTKSINPKLKHKKLLKPKSFLSFLE